MPASLREQFQDEERRRRVLDDAEQLLNAEVASKSGMTGMAVKAAFKVVKGVRPGFVRQVLRNLFDDFLGALEPYYEKAVESGNSPGAQIVPQADSVAEALLAITDQRAAKVDNAMVLKTYQKLRPTAGKHVAAAAPRLAKLLNDHADAT